tara:strand:- start:23169 stop:24131 length:963 start_codon:yes stop_codon:yes gene_type:complete
MKHLLYSLISAGLPIILGTSGKQRFSVLTFHRVLSKADYMRPNEPTIDRFDWQMELLARHFNPLSLSDALLRLREKTLPPRSVCVTFDDGYADNATLAMPILEKWKIPATVFVSTGYLNGGLMWNDSILESIRLADEETMDLSGLGLIEPSLTNHVERRKTAVAVISQIKHLPQSERDEVVQGIAKQVPQLPTDFMMTDEQVVELMTRGIEIGAHTVTHPIMSTLQSEDAEREVVESSNYLTNLLGKPVRFFAYPNGRPSLDYRERDRDLVKRLGFEAALSTQWGAVSAKSDHWQLPRFTPWDKTTTRFQARLLHNFSRV